VTLRQEILEYLKENGSATPNELSKALGRDRSTIRRLLASLKRKGIVHVELEKKGKVAYKYYALTEEGQKSCPAFI